MGTLAALFELFITFFQIGLFTFGGVYAMIPMIQQECSTWLTESEIVNFIAHIIFFHCDGCGASKKL